MRKQTRFWLPFLAVLLVGSGLAVGCAPAVTAPATPTTPASTAAVARPTAVPTATPPAAAYSQVEVATLGLSFEVPADWVRLDPEWAWSPAPEGPVRLGLRWADVEPPAEVEAVLLPQPAVVQGAEPLDTSWGRGRLYTVAVYDPDGQGLVRAVEDHALIVLTQDGTRRAVDMYVTAASDAELAALRPVLLHMVESSTMRP